MAKSTVILRFSGRSNAVVRKDRALVIAIHLDEDILERSVASVLPLCEDLIVSVEFDSLLERPIEEFASQKSGLLLLALLPNGDLRLPDLAVVAVGEKAVAKAEYEETASNQIDIAIISRLPIEDDVLYTVKSYFIS
jgi:hypothetical protein